MIFKITEIDDGGDENIVEVMKADDFIKKCYDIGV